MCVCDFNTGGSCSQGHVGGGGGVLEGVVGQELQGNPVPSERTQLLWFGGSESAGPTTLCSSAAPQILSMAEARRCGRKSQTLVRPPVPGLSAAGPGRPGLPKLGPHVPFIPLSVIALIAATCLDDSVSLEDGVGLLSNPVRLHGFPSLSLM